MQLSASFRSPIPHLEILGPAPADERAELTLVLRRRVDLPPGIRLSATSWPPATALIRRTWTR